MMFLILILHLTILLMGGETQGSSIGSTVKMKGRAVLGIGIPVWRSKETYPLIHIFSVRKLSLPAWF